MATKNVLLKIVATFGISKVGKIANASRWSPRRAATRRSIADVRVITRLHRPLNTPNTRGGLHEVWIIVLEKPTGAKPVIPIFSFPKISYFENRLCYTDKTFKTYLSAISKTASNIESHPAVNPKRCGRTKWEVMHEVAEYPGWFPRNRSYITHDLDKYNNELV